MDLIVVLMMAVYYIR